MKIINLITLNFFSGKFRDLVLQLWKTQSCLFLCFKSAFENKIFLFQINIFLYF